MGLGSSIGGVVSGILNKGSASAPDLSALFRTIEKSGERERDLINKLPENLQKQYAEYKASNAANIEALKAGTADLTKAYETKMDALYDPNAPAVKAALDAAKTSIYADLPGQQDAIRQALAATGGFDRGTASKQLAAPILQAAAKYGQAVQNVTAQQLQQKQQAQQQAIQTINNMDNNVLQQTFGMNKEQALMIMNSNRSDLKDQLTDLVNQSTRQTEQTLGVQGADITNKYNKAVADKAQRDAMNNAWVNLGVDVAETAGPKLEGFMQGLGGWSTGGTAESIAAGSYNPNMAAGQAARLGY